MPARIASGFPSRGLLGGVVCSPAVALAKVGADGAAQAMNQETKTAANTRRVMAGILLPKAALGAYGASGTLGTLGTFFLGLVDVRRLAEEDFRRFHQRLGQRRVRVN